MAIESARGGAWCARKTWSLEKGGEDAVREQRKETSGEGNPRAEKISYLPVASLAGRVE